MVFCVVADGGIDDIKELPECDIAVFGFRGLGEVNYEKELKGESEKFEEAAKLSKKQKCGLLCGCTTVSRGLVRKSVAVSDNGKLLGIADMTRVIDGEEYKGGSALGFYFINGCKLGICVENDLLFPETVSALAACGCNVIVAMLEEIKNNLPPLIIRAYSYLYGIPIVMCAGKMAYFADITGAIATSSQNTTLFEVSLKNCYHIVTTRRKGLSEDLKEDY